MADLGSEVDHGENDKPIDWLEGLGLNANDKMVAIGLEAVGLESLEQETTGSNDVANRTDEMGLYEQYLNGQEVDE